MTEIYINHKLEKFIDLSVKGGMNILFDNECIKKYATKDCFPKEPLKDLSKEEQDKMYKIVKEFFTSKNFNLSEKIFYFRKLSEEEKKMVLNIYLAFIHNNIPDNRIH